MVAAGALPPKTAVSGPGSFWSLPASVGAPTGAVVLLLHGLGCAARSFDQAQLARLCSCGRVVVPDLLGHGGSACPLGEEPYQMRQQAALWLGRIVALHHRSSTLYQIC